MGKGLDIPMFRDLIDLIGGGEPIEECAFQFVDAGGFLGIEIVPLAGVIFEVVQFAAVAGGWCRCLYRE